MSGRERASWPWRLTATIRGDVPLEEVRLMLAAGAVAYDDILAADELRSELAAARIDPWTASPAESSQLLCAWVGYALQSLAEAFVTSEADSGPPPAPGHLTPVTAEQASMLAAQVPAWSARARRAALDPGYDVAAEVALPAQPVTWVQVEPCPASHLTAMRTAAASMLERIEAALADVHGGADPERAGQSAQLSGMVAEAQGRLAPLAGSQTTKMRGQQHAQLEAVLRDGVQRCLVLGQLLARPRLASARPYPGWSAPAPVGPRWSQADHHHDHHDHHD